MNIFDIGSNFLVIAVSNKVGIINFDRLKTNNLELTGKVKYIIESQYIINHVKLMKGYNDEIYVLAADDSGILHSKKIKWNKNQVCEIEYKKFNCCIDAMDNSAWSLDCNFPFVAISGNHKCIIIINIEEISNNDEVIYKNIVLVGNNHNVPCVHFYEHFIACNSIDGKPKIWDLYNGKIIKVIDNKTTEWYYNIKT